jgi:CspA family cold shock protein
LARASGRFDGSATGKAETLQGVIKSYDPGSRVGVVVRETDRAEIELASDALEGSIFRMLRQGQRVVFDVDDQGLATHLRLGSEVDLGAPEFEPDPELER